MQDPTYTKEALVKALTAIRQLELQTDIKHIFKDALFSSQGFSHQIRRAEQTFGCVTEEHRQYLRQLLHTFYTVYIPWREVPLLYSASTNQPAATNTSELPEHPREKQRKEARKLESAIQIINVALNSDGSNAGGMRSLKARYEAFQTKFLRGLEQAKRGSNLVLYGNAKSVEYFVQLSKDGQVLLFQSIDPDTKEQRVISFAIRDIDFIAVGLHNDKKSLIFRLCFDNGNLLYLRGATDALTTSWVLCIHTILEILEAADIPDSAVNNAINQVLRVRFWELVKEKGLTDGIASMEKLLFTLEQCHEVNYAFPIIFTAAMESCI